MRIRNFVGRCVAAHLITVAAPLEAEPLWQTFSIGATKESVLNAYPGASLDEANSGPSVELYRIDDIPQPGMWIYFTFQDGLREVKIFGRDAVNYLSVTSSLEKKYGAPTSSSKVANSSLLIWDRASTKIVAKLEPSKSLGAGFVAHEPFTVTYSARSASPLDQGL